jgi:glycosyltransferase involved in cell wall biosynthesis
VRVVFLTHNFPRFEGDVAGAFLATLALALRPRGVLVSVVAPSDAGEPGPPELAGIPVRRVRYAAPSREVLAYRGTMVEAARTPSRWSAVVGLHRALREGAREELAAGARLVHAHWWIPGGLASPPEAPLVLTVHGTDGALLRRSRLARLVARPVFRRARLVSTVSAELARTVEATVGRTVTTEHILPMPVDTRRFDRWSDGGGGAIVVGRLTEQKRVELALQAIATLHQAGRPLPLTVVGDGPLRNRLTALAQSLGIAHQVRFLGMQSPAQVASLLANADVMVFPARGEGFGLAAAEALMAGVPVVACCDGGGVLDIVPRDGAGRIAQPTGPGIAAALAALLDGLQLAREAARELGRAWRVRLSPEYVAERYARWYHEVLRA